MEPLRLIAFALFMVLGAALALTTQPLFPTEVTSWVVKGQEVVSGTSVPNGLGATASEATKPRWTVPAGLITVRDLGPRATGGCDLTDCPPNPLLASATGKMKVSLQITPLAVAPDTDYAVVLSARDGHVYDSAQVRWSREDLIGIDPAERSLIKRKETEALHNRRVELEAPHDDVSVLPFIEDYNLVVDEAVRAYAVAKSKEITMDPMAAPIITALFPGALDSPEEPEAQFGLTEMERVVNKHFILELVEARALSARLRAAPPGGSGSGQPKP